MDNARFPGWRATVFAAVIAGWLLTLGGCDGWPTFRHDVRHTGLSSADTSADTGAQK
jgi:hypothetical protein